MAGPPKLKRGNDRDQDVQYQRGWPDGCGYEPEQCHHGDVAGRAGVTDAGIKERDDADRQKKEDEMRVVHSLSCRAKLRQANDEARMTNDEGSPNAQMTKGESAFFRDFFVTRSSFGVSFSSVIGALSFLRHSSFELRHFLERFLDFAGNDKKVTRDIGSHYR